MFSSSAALQVLFLLYHYFNAREIYNAIRVFIAGYVWMTGYGNFLYYYHYKDFSLGRCASGQCSSLGEVSQDGCPSACSRARWTCRGTEACIFRRLGWHR